MGNYILIAEDEPKLRSILCDYFISRGDTPVPAADGTAGCIKTVIKSGYKLEV